MQIIPLAAIASQTLKVVLAQQSCVLNIYQKSTGLFMDVILEGETILAGVLCRDRVRCVRQGYLGFSGDLAFMDTQGAEDAYFQGLGSRWVLMYLEPGDPIDTTISTSINFQSRIGAADAWAKANPLILSGALASGMQGSPYSSAIAVHGQMPGSSLSWSVVGSLPAGLDLNHSTGLVSGTPSAGLTSTSFTLKVKDNLGRTTTSAQTVKIGQTFTMASSLPGIMSLSRASVGTYFDPAATLQTAAVNQARFDYDPTTLLPRGLLLEESRTNLITNSEDFGSWTVGGTATVVVNNAAAPNGAMTADTLTLPNNAAIFRSSLFSVAAGAAHAFSVYAKKNTGNFIMQFRNSGGTQSVLATVNTNTGTITAGSATSGTLLAVFVRPGPGGYDRYVMLASLAVAEVNNARVGVSGATGLGNPVVWGAQLELGSNESSYISTDSSANVRAADVATIVVPSGFTTLTYGYDDGTSSQETVGVGPHTIPTPIAPKRVKTISVTP